MPEKLPDDEKQPVVNKSMIEDLKSTDTGLRRQAVLDCMENYNLDCIPQIQKLISTDTDPGVRSVSAIALGEYKDLSSLNKIIALKKDKEIFPDTIIDALSRMKDPKAGPHLIEYLDSDNHTTRLSTVEALFQCNAINQGSAILKMARANRDPEKDKTYAMAIGRVRYKPGEDYLIQNVRNAQAEEPTIAASVLALGKIGSRKSTELLIQKLVEDKSKIRENSYIALKEIRDPSTFPKLIGYLSNPERELRYLAAGIIATLPNEENKRKIRAIFQANNTLSLGPAAKILGEWKDEVSRPAIEERLTDLSSPDREELALSLGWIGNSESETVLWKVIREKSGEARYGAAWSLGFLGTEKSIPVLIEAGKSQDRRLAIQSIESLGVLKNPKALNDLVKFASDDNLAPFAISSLGEIEGDEARKQIEELALSNKLIQSKLAIEAIANRKEKKSIPVLKKILESGNKETKKLAKFAILSIENADKEK
ncbi:HEAT repeat domain-containing protein [Leptospira sp. GIMC2001]|uniref:HEAT repeat domain-containing protein n=1 Tax=Leptospira sp. GIMC2001 TaxID=1513297 RepID=UPI00234B15AD|nr:HEAT repeat domain-containing protein [Leptospira sp. GIMC2001]WCL49930.1 HEAT repeat domain-containing protein [Leptospira sp. GIMC2001]